jgi:hypothetical protein
MLSSIGTVHEIDGLIQIIKQAMPLRALIRNGAQVEREQVAEYF